MTLYSYTKSPCAIDRLTQEIQLSSIATTLDHIDLLGSDLSVWFVADLSVGDKTSLDALVSAHSGTPLNQDFIELTSTTSTSTTSSSYVVLDSMVSPAMLPGTYMISFSGTFKSNAPLLSNPGIILSVFNNGVQIPASEIIQDSSSNGLMPTSPLGISTNCSVTIAANQKVDIRWKTNGAGNTITCLNRVLDIMRIK